MGKKKAEAEPASSVAPAEKVSKMDMVREALKAGVDKAQDGVEWIKAKYGADIPNNIFSQYKSNIKKKEEGESPKIRTKGSATSPTEAFRQVKELCEQFGADEVRAMVTLVESFED